MHNLHLIRVRAESPKEACSMAERFIEDFGNENNWRSIGGCVSENNEVYDRDEMYGSRWRPSYTDDKGNKPYGNIRALNESIIETIKSNRDSYYGKELVDDIDSGKVRLSDVTDTHKLYQLGKFIENQKAIAYLGEGFDIDTFNILEHDYKEYQYTEFGVTDCYEEGGDKTYIVLVDMHD
jgi:hypothetical protein